MIRKAAVTHFAGEHFRKAVPDIDPSLLVDAFPQFLFAHEFNRLLANTGHDIIVGREVHNVGYRQWYLSNVRMMVNYRDVVHSQQRFHMFCEALPMFEGVDERLSANRSTLSLKSGGELLIDFICPGQEEHMDKRSYPDIHDGRPMRNERDGLGADDLMMLDTMSLLASTYVINYIGGDVMTGSERTKKLDTIAYNLKCSDRVEAVCRIVNSVYSGENGEDILVHNLMTGRTYGAFSLDFGTSQEWINSRPERGSSNRAGPFEYTAEETNVLEAYMKVLQEVTAKSNKG